jgi:hypothetical protein
VSADLARAFDAGLDVDAEFNAECLSDGVAPQQDRFRERALQGSCISFERCKRQRADRAETDVALQLEVDFVVDVIDRWRFHDCSGEKLGELGDFVADLTRWLA